MLPDANNRTLDLQINRQIELVKTARERQAVGEQYAPDSLTFKGVRFFRPTLAHQWLFARLRYCRFTGPEQRDAALAYVLSRDAAAVRDSLFAALETDTLDDLAVIWQIKHDLSASDLDAALKLLLPPIDQARGDGRLSPYWWAQAVHRLAVHYCWSEAVIFALPWDRARAYLDCISEYHGHNIVRHLAELPEEVELRELMQRRYSPKASAPPDAPQSTPEA